jgi:predicted  nucleic acid-binding Zn-ribbon protein
MLSVKGAIGAIVSTVCPRRESRMTHPQQLRQRLLDLLVDVDAWMSDDDALRAQLTAAQEQIRRLDHERLGAVLRLESELAQSNVEWNEKVADLESQIRVLSDQVLAQNAEIEDARQRFAKVLEIRPERLADLTDKALVLIEESKKILRENL